MIIKYLKEISEITAHMDEIAYGIREYQEFVGGTTKDLFNTLTDCYDFNALGYSVEDEVKELSKEAVIIMNKRLAILSRMAAHKCSKLALMCEISDEEKEDAYDEDTF